jgi:hypothetical protein
VTNDTFSIRLVRGEEVKYEVESVSEEKGTVEIKLMFSNPSNVSNKMVRYYINLSIIIFDKSLKT